MEIRTELNLFHTGGEGRTESTVTQAVRKTGGNTFLAAKARLFEVL